MDTTINRLLFQRAYLIGPMDHDRESGKQWRIDLFEWLIKRGVVPLDPYNKPVHKLHMDGLEDDDNYHLRVEATERGDFDKLSELMKPIVSIDLRMVDHADFLVCNLDMTKRPCGTFDELFMAASQNKPIIIRCPQGKKNIPPWLFGRLPHQLFFESWEEVTEYLHHIDTAPKIETLDRWKFFDVKPIMKEILSEKNYSSW